MTCFRSQSKSVILASSAWSISSSAANSGATGLNASSRLAGTVIMARRSAQKSISEGVRRLNDGVLNRYDLLGRHYVSSRLLHIKMALLQSPSEYPRLLEDYLEIQFDKFTAIG